MRVGTQGLFCPFLKTLVGPFLPTRLTVPGSPRMLVPLRKEKKEAGCNFTKVYTEEDN